MRARVCVYAGGGRVTQNCHFCHQIEAGIMTRHLITTRAQPGTCNRCRRSIMRSHSEGLPTAVDADPIPADREYLVLLDGLWTYSIDGRGELWHRAEWRIRTRRLDPTIAIHVQHKCPDRAEQLALQLDA